MIGKIVFLSVTEFLLLAHGYASVAKPEYTMETSLHPLRMSVTDLSSLLGKVNRFVLANRSTNDANNVSTNELALSDGVRRFQMSGDFSIHALEAAPNVSYDASYTYRASDGAITRVSIDLRDSYRRILVSGSNQEQVEALAQLLHADLQDYEIYWGGFGARFIAFQVLLIAGASIFWRGVWSNRHIAVKISGSVLLISFAFIFLANETLTPGSAIYKGSPSLLVRFEPEISFWGLVVTTIGVVVTLVISWRGRRAQVGQKGAGSESSEKRSSSLRSKRNK